MQQHRLRWGTAAAGGDGDGEQAVRGNIFILQSAQEAQQARQSHEGTAITSADLPPSSDTAHKLKAHSLTQLSDYPAPVDRPPVRFGSGFQRSFARRQRGIAARHRGDVLPELPPFLPHQRGCHRRPSASKPA